MEGLYSGHLLSGFILHINQNTNPVKIFYMQKIKSFLLVFLLLAGGLSCKKSFLDETPLDTLSSSNAFQTASDFTASVNNLYRLVRAELYTLNDNAPMEYPDTKA